MEWNNEWNEFFDDEVVDRELKKVRKEYSIEDRTQREFFKRGYVNTEITCGLTDTQNETYNGYEDFDELEWN
jgi:hypothetical protein|tara:strand:- start:231 stop:446 length:216 start_codon:yes stop_codon:yes gene_type:complete